MSLRNRFIKLSSNMFFDLRRHEFRTRDDIYRMYASGYYKTYYVIY